MKTLEALGIAARNATFSLNQVDAQGKNQILAAMADALMAEQTSILEANAEDMMRAREKNTSEAMLDRLLLTKERIQNMAEGLRQLIELKDPIGEMDEMWKNKDNLMIGRMRVPLGVILMIYEARPNVTVDAAGLCLKSGNVALLRGSGSALTSNQRIVTVLREAIAQTGNDPDCIQLVEDVRHESVNELLKMNDHIDLVIPRGGESLIKNVIQNATIPVIETGLGNCHLYIDAPANIDQGIDILVNGKVQRPGVCNALETLLVHEAIADDFLPRALKTLMEHDVTIRGCEKTAKYHDAVQAVTDEDYGTEFKDLILAVRVVPTYEDALDHIRTYSSKHTEVIVSENYERCMHFLKNVDAACVNANASSRFSDGFQYGFGAEIGISTQKMHARGPMGLNALTSYKYVVLGNGQIRS